MAEPAVSAPGADARRLHEAAWPDMFANLQAAYAELAQTRFELERHAAETEEARDLFQRVVESMSEALFLTDRAGRVVQTNPAARALLGRGEEELIGRPLAVACGTAEIPATPWQLLERSPSGTAQNLEAEIRTASGVVVPVSASCGLMRDKRGRLIGLVAVLRDVTERKRAEEAQRFLAEASHMLAASLEQETTLAALARIAVPFLGDVCLVDVVSPDGAVHRVAVACAQPSKNEAVEELRRYPPDPAQGEGVGRALRTGEPALYEEVTAAVLEAATRDAAQRRLYRALGLRSAMVAPLVARGRTLGALTLLAAESGRRYGPDDLALAQDLARRAALAVDNARLYQEAQAAIRARDDFVSSAAHDLKTPLTAMLNRAQLLARRAERAPEAPPDRRSVEQIVGEARRLRDMVEELLDVTRAEHGLLVGETERVDLADLARDACRHAPSERHACVVEAQGPVEGLYDRRRIAQLLDNLVGNAVKYSPDGGEVRLRVWRDGGEAHVTVSDRGIGIPAADLPRVFDRFHRAGNVDDRRFVGLGLGLYICRKIVEQHRGRIEASSPGPGQGSTFRVTLPALPVPIGGERDG